MKTLLKYIRKKEKKEIQYNILKEIQVKGFCYLEMG